MPHKPEPVPAQSPFPKSNTILLRPVNSDDGVSLSSSAEPTPPVSPVSISSTTKELIGTSTTNMPVNEVNAVVAIKQRHKRILSCHQASRLSSRHYTKILKLAEANYDMVPQPVLYTPLDPDQEGPLQEFVRPTTDTVFPLPTASDFSPSIKWPEAIVAMISDADHTTTAPPPAPLLPTSVDFILPDESTNLQPPTAMLPPQFTERRDNPDDTVGTRPTSTYGVILPPARTAMTRPPYYTALAIRGPNNKLLEFYGFYDSGSNKTMITPSLATLLGITAATDSTSLRTIAASDRAISYWSNESVTLWHGTNYAVHLDSVGIMDMPSNTVPYMLISRDLGESIGITVQGLEHRFPTELAGNTADGDFKDLNDRNAQRVSDVDNLSPEMAAARDPVRARLQADLDALRQAVPINSFISHPRATVQVLHQPGTPPAYKKQYGGKHKSLLDTYITHQVDLWLDNGKLVKWDPEKHGYSPVYNMPLLPVVTRDPSGQIKKVRVCVDARHVNIGIVNDDTPLPNISRLFSDMASNKWFSEFDMESAFNQFPVDEASQHKLAVNWKGNVYCFAGAPFGLKHISAHVQRVLGEIFADMPFVRIYVDNLIVASPDLASHEEHCRRFIERCLKYKILLSPDKCKLCFTKLKTLGNIITERGVCADPEKVATVQRWELPSTPKELSSFLSFSNYLRGYVRHYADLAAPLDAMRCRKELHWTPILIDYFHRLKHAIANAPALNFPDYDRPFALAVDSSITGIGAVLFQPKNSGDRPDVDNIIAFCSRSLKTYEKRYSVYKLELNALVYGLQQYEDILFGRHFTVLTDHQSLTYLHTQRDLHRTLRNWYATVCEFDFDIIHIPGHLNVLADTLSRMYEREWGLVTNTDKSDAPAAHHAHVFFLDDSPIPDTNWYDMDCPPGGSIFHATAEPLDRNTTPVRIPATDEERRRLITAAHAEGHFGTRAVHAALRRDGVSWMGMSRMIKDICASCRQCQSWNASRAIFHPTRSPRAILPWDQIQLDTITSFAEKPSEPDGARYILIITDVFTSFCILEPMLDKSATTVARALWKSIGIFGPPKEIHSDNGTEFGAEVIRSLIQNAAVGSAQRFITAYNPHQSGKVESHVKIAISALRRMIDTEQTPAWSSLLPMVQLFINSKHRTATNSSPFALMFNRAHNAFQYYTQLDVDTVSPLSFADWLARQQHLHTVIFPVIGNRLHALQAKYHKAHEVKRLTTTKALPNGTIVMVKDMLRKDKSDPPFVGPYMVMRCTTAGAYTLKDAAGGLFHRDVSRHHLKIVTSDAFVKDFDEAQYVSAIVGHEVRDGRIHYLTQFVGFQDPEWVPEENIDDKQLIRRYLATKKVIPAKLKNLRPVDQLVDPILASHSTAVSTAKNFDEISSAIQNDMSTAESSAVASSSVVSQPTGPTGDIQRHHRSRKPSQAIRDNAALLAHSTCPFFPNVQDLSL